MYFLIIFAILNKITRNETQYMERNTLGWIVGSNIVPVPVCMEKFRDKEGVL